MILTFLKGKKQQKTKETGYGHDKPQYTQQELKITLFQSLGKTQVFKGFYKTSLKAGLV